MRFKNQRASEGSVGVASVGVVREKFVILTIYKVTSNERCTQVRPYLWLTHPTSKRVSHDEVITESSPQPPNYLKLFYKNQLLLAVPERVPDALAIPLMRGCLNQQLEGQRQQHRAAHAGAP
ncbi:hypothetical protein ABH943_001638 [Caballeronia udeis]|uniref:Uncharacterized protein n=1 Tax=Caballeronia udeis TaxID=1232866 RepID=A0ABW8MD73_9BURK